MAIRLGRSERDYGRASIAAATAYAKGIRHVMRSLMDTSQGWKTGDWPIQGWTTAPLRLEKVIFLPAAPEVIFTTLTEPTAMCRIFSWMHQITIDNRTAVQQNGLGAIRRCHFGNGMVLEEVIVGWEPPIRYAYRGVDQSHPFGMRGHLGIIACRPTANSTRLCWQHYFDHSNPVAMGKQLDASMQMALQSLKEHFQRSQTSNSKKGKTK